MEKILDKKWEADQDLIDPMIKLEQQRREAQAQTERERQAQTESNKIKDEILFAEDIDWDRYEKGK